MQIKIAIVRNFGRILLWVRGESERLAELEIAKAGRSPKVGKGKAPLNLITTAPRPVSPCADTTRRHGQKKS